MKKLLLLLLCVPLIGFGQGDFPEENECISGNCINGHGEYIYWTGSMVESTEAKYIGQFKNGDIYEGVWINDKKQGRGKMIYNDGSIKDGIWGNGEFIGE